MTQTHDLKLKIEGMHCGACVRRVTAALAKVEGVQVKNVEVGSVEVTIGSPSVTPGNLIAAVNAIGFTATAAG